MTHKNGRFIGLIVIVIVILILIVIITAQLEVIRYYRIWNKLDPKRLDERHRSMVQNTRRREGRIVVSLSTIPDRIDKIGPTIGSLLDQTYPVNEIAINIPWKSRKGMEYTIPPWLQEMSDDTKSCVKIYRVEEDVGPGTKLIPTLQREQDDVMVIAVDDDVIYHSKTVQVLFERYVKSGKKHAVTNFGIILQNDGSLPTMISRVSGFFTRSHEVDLLQGFSGFLTTRRMFKYHDVYELKNGPKEAISVDDIWFSGWLNLSGTKIVSAGYTYLQLPLVNVGKMRTTTALGKTENVDFIRDQKVINWFLQEKKMKLTSK